MTHHAGPYKLPNGGLVALNWNDLLDGTLVHAIDVSHGGSGPGDYLAYTATMPDRTLHPPLGLRGSCGDWTSICSGYGGYVGLVHFVNGSWTTASGGTRTTQKALYCIEQ